MRSITTTLPALFLAAACGGLLGAGPAKDDASKPRVQGTWQQKLVGELDKGKPESTEAWGLFSKGGWADNGQVMVFAAKDGGGKVEIVDPAKKTVSSQRTLSPAELDAFKKKVAGADQLADVKSTAMDAIVYEYVHAAKGTDGKVEVQKRVLYQTSSAKNPDHDALVAAFQDLRPKTAKR